MKKVLKVIGTILLVIVIVIAAGIGYLTIAEYRPEDEETLAVEGTSSSVLHVGDSLTVMSWNIGYGALGDNADFFMDGGTSVKTADEARVNENMVGVLAEMEEINADIYFFQEADEDSTRSNHTNEVEMLKEAESGKVSSFAYNFKVQYVPYPIPPIGEVNSGLLTLSSYDITESTRIKLPNPFS